MVAAKAIPRKNKGIKRVSKRPKRPSKDRKALKVLPVLIVLTVAVWVLMWGPARGTLFTRFARLGTVQVGALEVAVHGEALILRTESLYRAPIGGVVKVLLHEGERVRVGSAVLEIANPSMRQELEAQSGTVHLRLAEFDAKEAQVLAALRTEVAQIDHDILEATSRLQEAIKHDDTRAIAQSWDAVNTLMDLRNEKAEELSALEEILEGLLEEKSRLARQIGESSSAVESAQTGILSYLIDGLEAQLSPERSWEVTAATVYQVDVSPEPVSSGQRVEAGDLLFKVVDVSNIRLSLALPSQDALKVAEKGQVSVRFLDPKGHPFRAQAIDVGKKTGDDYGIVTLQVEEFLEEMVGSRRVKVEVIVDTYEGVLVPARAIVEESGVTGVYVVEKATARFRQVTVRASDADNYVVEGIPAGVYVVLTPSLVRDGSAVR